MSTLKEIADNYQDVEHHHKQIHEYFCHETNKIPELKELRDWVESNIFGFGERSFYYMWKLIVDEMPKEFTFLEIGVFRGQTLALIQILAKLAGKKAHIYGVTPLDNTDGHWDSDYAKDIETIHDKFALDHPNIIIGLSTDAKVINHVNLTTFDLVYIDGGHTYDVVKQDLQNYCHLATKYLVIDDCANKFKLANGMFAGIEPVSKAVDEFLPPYTSNDKYTYLCNIVHNRIWEVNN